MNTWERMRRPHELISSHSLIVRYCWQMMTLINFCSLVCLGLSRLMPLVICYPIILVYTQLYIGRSVSLL